MTLAISWFDPAEIGTLVEALSATIPLETSNPGLLAYCVPHGAMGVQINHLLDWLKQNIPRVKSAFVADAEGLPIGDSSDDITLAVAAAACLRTLGEMKQVLRSELRFMTMALDSGDVLHLVPVETQSGWLVVGLISEEMIEEVYLNVAGNGLIEVSQDHRS